MGVGWESTEFGSVARNGQDWKTACKILPVRAVCSQFVRSLTEVWGCTRSHTEPFGETNWANVERLRSRFCSRLRNRFRSHLRSRLRSSSRECDVASLDEPRQASFHSEKPAAAATKCKESPLSAVEVAAPKVQVLTEVRLDLMSKCSNETLGVDRTVAVLQRSDLALIL